VCLNFLCSQAQLDAQRHGQAAFSLLVASVLSRCHDDLSGMAAAYPAVMPQPVNAQLADDCRAALGVMQSGCVSLHGGPHTMQATAVLLHACRGHCFSQA